MSYCPIYDNKKFLDNEPIWILPCLKHNFVWKNEKENNKGEKEEKEKKQKNTFDIIFDLFIAILLY